MTRELARSYRVDSIIAALKSRSLTFFFFFLCMLQSCGLRMVVLVFYLMRDGWRACAIFLGFFSAWNQPRLVRACCGNAHDMACNAVIGPPHGCHLYTRKKSMFCFCLYYHCREVSRLVLLDRHSSENPDQASSDQWYHVSRCFIRQQAGRGQIVYECILAA
ncbi:hypothetical protein HDV57DRAFT_192397 [Trichoderma longibrachiatum]